MIDKVEKNNEFYSKPNILNQEELISHTYMIQNLYCAHCGAKIEQALNELPEIDSAVLTYATRKFLITAKNHLDLLPKMQQVAEKIEDGVILIDADNLEALEEISSDLVHEHHHGHKLAWLQNKRSEIEIIFCSIIFLVAEFSGLLDGSYRLLFLLVAYVILGRNTILMACKNILHGNIFDENFLMTIATVGALAINAWEEAVGVMLFYRIGEYFEERAVTKSRSQIMAVVDLRPEKVNLLVNDEIKSIPAKKAKLGDIVIVRAGDRIPLDGVIIKGESLVDTSPITGEFMPVKWREGDKAISGCVNTNGILTIRVEKLLSDSMVTRILNSVEKAAASKPAIDRFITKFARTYTPTVVVIALFTAIIPSLITGEWEKWIYTALTFLVISCPCALVLSVPLSFFGGVGAASKYGILFKGGIVLEALKNVKAVILDKTGTLTYGNFVIQEIKTFNKFSQKEILRWSAEAERVSKHPLANSIVEAAVKEKIAFVQPDSFEEFAGEGIAAYFSEKFVLCGNVKLMQRFHIDYSNYTATISGSEVLVALDGIFAGQIIINDSIKEDAASSVKKLEQMNIVSIMLTGDSRKAATAVGETIGINKVYSQLLPQEKLSLMQNLRNEYGSVMFVGDGINDAPVLAGADVGAAMGNGADAAIEACDVVFMNSKIESIIKAIAIAKLTSNIAWQNIIFALGIKFIILAAGILGYASMWAAVFADTGVALLCVLNSMKILYQKV